jgi:porphobilinogen deaminase
MTTLKIGTRRSQLALWQAGYVRNALRHAHAGIDVDW